MRSPWGHWLQISRELEQTPHLLLFFDSDGRLAPSVERPLDGQILPEAGVLCGCWRAGPVARWLLLVAVP